MHVKRFADAKPYEAPNHRNYTSLRLFGAEAGGTKGPMPHHRRKSISFCAANSPSSSMAKKLC
jgi:hypothetical protein